LICQCISPFLSEEREVPLTTNGSKFVEIPVDKVVVGGLRDRRVCEINIIEGVGAGGADFLARCGWWW